jgi:hypothetical protein
MVQSHRMLWVKGLSVHAQALTCKALLAGENAAQLVHSLQRHAAPTGHAGQRVFGHQHRQTGFFGQQAVQVAQQGTATRRMRVSFAWNNMAIAELRDLNRHRYGYGNGHPDRYRNLHCYGYSDCNVHCHCNGDRHCHCNGDQDGNGY